MSDEPQATPDQPKRPRRTAKKAATKKAKPAAAEVIHDVPAVAHAEPKAEVSTPVVRDAPAPQPAAPSAPLAPSPWPEPETIAKPQGEGSGKRKRRRRKKKGGDHHPQTDVHAAEGHAEPDQAPAPKPQQPQRMPLDANEVADYAWKIFRAELAEEGLALVDDHDAREITRRSFRLAEVFLEEKARRSK